jgi:hypothetical protein
MITTGENCGIRRIVYRFVEGGPNCFTSARREVRKNGVSPVCPRIPPHSRPRIPLSPHSPVPAFPVPAFPPICSSVGERCIQSEPRLKCESGPMKNDSTRNSDVEMLLPFLREDRRSRWRELFPRPKGRKKLLATLWNGDDLNRDLLIKVDPSERSVKQLSVRLRSLGAPPLCHLISARPNLDGKDLDLISALGLVLDLAPGTIICCVPGKLAYYENDDRNGNYIILGRGVTPRRTSGTR